MTAGVLDIHLTEDDAEAALAADVRTGLTARPKNLPPKWFYDARGSELFEEITRLPEYYPTRTERALLEGAVDEIAALAQADTLVELGSGSSEKTRLLLDALRRADGLATYVPQDVSASSSSRVFTDEPEPSSKSVSARASAAISSTAPSSRARSVRVG